MKNYELMDSAKQKINEYFSHYEAGLISEEETMYSVKTIAAAVFDAVERLYQCSWGENYEPKEPTVEHIIHFTVDNGYDIDSFKKIADLKFGESVTFYESGIHSVTRIK